MLEIDTGEIVAFILGAWVGGWILWGFMIDRRKEIINGRHVRSLLEELSRDGERR